MAINPILDAIDDPEHAAYLAERRGVRRRRLLAIVAVLGVVTMTLGWKVGRHMAATSWLHSNHYRVTWELDGKTSWTGGETSVKYTPGWMYFSNTQPAGDLPRLLLLHHLVSLDLSGLPNLNDDALEVLERLSTLKELNLDRILSRNTFEAVPTYLTDKTLSGIASLTELKVLNIGGQRITDLGVAHLAKLKNLESIELHETAITDAGLETLKSIPGLKMLCVTGTRVSAEGVRKFQEARPDVKLVTDPEIAPPLKP